MSAIILDNDGQRLIGAINDLSNSINILNNAFKQKETTLNLFFENIAQLAKAVSISLSEGGREKSVLNDSKNNNNTSGLGNETNKEKNNFDEYKAGIIKGPQSINQAAAGGLYKFESEFGNSLKNVQNLVYNSSIAMRDNMNNFFFDAMTGKLKTAEEYFKSFLTAIQKAIAQFLANEITNKLIKTLFGGLFDDKKPKDTAPNMSLKDYYNGGYPTVTIPKKEAIGGRIALNTPFIAGENGPELINIDGAGATVISNNTTQSMLAGQSNLTVEVNVINQSGTQMQASQGESRFDGQKYVVDVFLDAWARDVSGLRTAVGGRR